MPEKKPIGNHRARLRKKGNLFRYRAYFERNILRFVRARAHVRALMTVNGLLYVIDISTLVFPQKSPLSQISH